ncbi:unnamed protein product [Ostreobium quekettii]|uniref:Uncharacterized protein n=1 Tax=Ostreobium quekettii TaxID=121088 RepID=A0A8S1IYV0_9CHLO|nr:unnamed protein product [Ostreobium quekettii]
MACVAFLELVASSTIEDDERKGLERDGGSDAAEDTRLRPVASVNALAKLENMFCLQASEEYRHMLVRRDQKPASKPKDKLAETKRKEAEVRAAAKALKREQKEKKKMERIETAHAFRMERAFYGRSKRAAKEEKKVSCPRFCDCVN